MKLLEIERGHVPQCPIAGDATAIIETFGLARKDSTKRPDGLSNPVAERKIIGLRVTCGHQSSPWFSTMLRREKKSTKYSDLVSNLAFSLLATRILTGRLRSFISDTSSFFDGECIIFVPTFRAKLRLKKLFL